MPRKRETEEREREYEQSLNGSELLRFLCVFYWISHFQIDEMVLTEKSAGIDRYTLKEERENYIFGSRWAFTKSIFLSLLHFIECFPRAFLELTELPQEETCLHAEVRIFFLISFNVHMNFYLISLALDIHLSSSSVCWIAFSLHLLFMWMRPSQLHLQTVLEIKSFSLWHATLRTQSTLAMCQ